MAEITAINHAQVFSEFLEDKIVLFDNPSSAPSIVKRVVFDEGGPNETLLGVKRIDEFPISGKLENVKFVFHNGFAVFNADFVYDNGLVWELIQMPQTYSLKVSDRFVASIGDVRFLPKPKFLTDSDAPVTQTLDFNLQLATTSETHTISIEPIVDKVSGNVENAEERGFTITSGSTLEASGSFEKVSGTFTLTFTKSAPEVLVGFYNIRFKITDGVDEQFIDFPVEVK